MSQFNGMVPLSQSDIMQNLSVLGSSAVGGDFSALMSSINRKPEQLSPEERKKLSERLGLSKSPLAGVVDVLGNPLVLLGLAGTLLFKMPSIAEEMSAVAKSGQVVNRFKPLEWLLPHKANYEGTLIPALLEEVQAKRAGLNYELQTKMRDAIAKTFGKETISNESQYRISAYLDGLSNPNAQPWKRLLRGLGFEEKTGYVNPEVAAEFGYTPGQVQNLVSRVNAIGPVKLTERELAFAKEVRGIYDHVWDKVFKERENLKEIVDHFPGMNDIEKEDLLDSLKGSIQDYFPHIMQMSPEMRNFQQLEALQNMAPQSFKSSALRASRQNLALNQATERILNRRGGLLPDPKALESLGLDGNLIEAIKRMDAKGVAGTYSLSLKHVTESYFNDAARVYAWTIPHEEIGTSLGKQVYEEGTRMLARGTQTDRVKVRTLNDTLIPMTLGMLSDSQMSQAMVWGQMKEWAVSKLESPVVRKVLGTRIAGNLRQSITEDPGWSLAGVSGGIANYLHSSTLGGNALAATMNLLQTVTTLLPKVGTDVFRGINDVSRRIPEYIKYRTGGKAAFEALSEAFPEYHAAHLELDPGASKALQDAMESAYQSSLKLPMVVQKGYHKIEQGLMSMFSSTEQFNRLVSFYSSRAKALRELPGEVIDHPILGSVKVPSSGVLRDRLASEYARRVTFETQFGSGPLERPSALLNVPPALTQFTTYPFRLAGMTAKAALENPALFSRMMLASGAAYGIGHEFLHQDLTQGLLFGGLPNPEEGVVPPIFGIASGAWKAAALQDSSQFRRNLPLLVPGGIGASRVVGMVPGGEGIARFIGRGYADYDNRAPDGRVPVYNASNALTGYYRDSQLWLRALGIGNATPQQEILFTKFLEGNRDRIRQMKRDYLQAVYENDMDGAMRISEQYERAYPGIGGLQVSKTDIRALHMRRDVTRMERLLETLPPEARPQFSAMIAMGIGSDAPAFMGLMDNFTGNTIAERENYRYNKIGGTQDRVSQGLHGESLRDQLRQQGIQQAYDNRREYAASSPLGDLPSY